MPTKKKKTKQPSHLEPKLIVLSAPSGAGKSTLAEMLIQNHPHIHLSISHTTRAPRGAEIHGTHYFFVDAEEFEDMIANHAFIEYALVFGKDWYGTSRIFVDETLAQGHSVLFDIDVQGAKSLKKLYGKRCVTVFIHPPSLKELEKRLRARRTESEEALRMRLETANKEISAASTFDYEIVNHDLSKTYAALEKILQKECTL